MNVPDRLVVRVVSDRENDLSGIIVQLKVSTGQRNPRHIHFPKTDAAGQAKLERPDFLGQFRDATEADLMGSWGNVEQASPLVEVSLYDPSPALAAGKSDWQLFPHERTKWSSRAAEYAYRTTCRNLEFTAGSLIVDVEKNPEFQLQVTRKPHGAG